MSENKGSKSRVVVIVVITLAFIVLLLFLSSYEKKRDGGISDTGEKYIVDEVPVGELITPQPAQQQYKPTLEYLGDTTDSEDDTTDTPSFYNPYTYNCIGVITDEESMLEQVKLISTIQNQQSRMSEMAVSEQFFDYVIEGNCALDIGAVYKYGINNEEFFVITSDYLICGYLDPYNQICAMYYQELKK